MEEYGGLTRLMRVTGWSKKVIRGIKIYVIAIFAYSYPNSDFAIWNRLGA